MIYKSLLSCQPQCVKLKTNIKTSFVEKSLIWYYLNFSMYFKIILYSVYQKFQLKIMSKSRKNLSSFFHQIEFIVFKKEWLKKDLLNCSTTSFFFQIYTT